MIGYPSIADKDVISKKKYNGQFAQTDEDGRYFVLVSEGGGTGWDGNSSTTKQYLDEKDLETVYGKNQRVSVPAAWNMGDGNNEYDQFVPLEQQPNFLAGNAPVAPQSAPFTKSYSMDAEGNMIEQITYQDTPAPPPQPTPPPVVTPQPAPTPPPAPVAAPPVAESYSPTPPPPTGEPVYQEVSAFNQPAPQPAPVAAPTPAPTPEPVATPTTTASPTMATTSNIDPTIQPYLSYGLSEAQKLYQGGGPQYYGGQTYVSPSEQTQTGLQALEQRASKGSPLTGAAQSQLQGTIQGNYLSGNPFFQGAFNPAAQAAESKFKQSLGDIGSAASKAGRYGSGAMSTMQQGASGQFAKTLADTAGTLAYQNYADERGRQQAATMAAPAMAQADYADIQNMLKAGQMREGYTGAQQQADIAKFNYQQTQPLQNLANFTSTVYGNPLGRMQQGSTGAAAQPSGWQNLLGGAATAAGIYKTLGGTQGLSQIGNWLSGGAGAYNPETQSGGFTGSSLAPFFYGSGGSGD
jgi:hypothetical protein